MTETKVFAKLNSPIIRSGCRDALDELKIMVDYQKAGYNYFSGNFNEGGVYVYFTPVHRSGMITSQSLLGELHECGYKILLKPLNRKSQKQINLMAEKVIPHAQEIADLYCVAKHREIYDKVKQLIGE